MPKRSVPGVFKVTRPGRAPTWRARLHLPVPGQIKPQVIDFYAPTRAEAIAKRDAYKPPQPGIDAKTRFCDFLTEEFIPYLEAETKPTGSEVPKSYLSFANRRARLNNYLLKSEVPGVRSSGIVTGSLGELTASILEDYFRAIIKARCCSPRVLKELRTDLRLAIRFAGKRVPVKPAELLELGLLSDKIQPNETKRKKPIFDPERVLSAVTDDSKPLEHRALVAFAFVTLSRPSEQFALTWDDVDLENGTVRFDKAMRLTADGYEATPGTKVRDGVVPVFEPALTLLKALYDRSRGQGHVFLTSTGLPINNLRLRRLWPQIRKSLGLPGLTYYRLKASGNSYLADRGVPAEVRAQIARWSSTRMASDVYYGGSSKTMKAVGNVFAAELARLSGVSDNRPGAA